MDNSEKYIGIATAGKPVGLQGDCRIFPIGETLQSLSLPYTLYVKKRGEYVEEELLKISRGSGNGQKATFKNYSSRETVDLLKNQVLYIKENDLPSAKEDEFYFYQLKGLDVEDQQGEKIGTVKEVFNYPTTDAIDIKLDKDGSVVTFPFRKETVLSVNLSEKIIVVDEELLEELL